MKMFTLFLLVLCMVAAEASIAEARCGRIFGGVRARRAARVERRMERRDARVERRDERRADAELISAPKEVVDEIRFAVGDE